jgi:uncharacterized protein (UPF0262 family)
MEELFGAGFVRRGGGSQIEITDMGKMALHTEISAA